MPKITFPARFEFLYEIRELVGQVAHEGGFSDKEVYSLQLASDEAASNIIEHAYEGVSNASFDVTCEMHGETIFIAMRDTGMPFDPTKVKQPNLKADLSERQIGGLGVYRAVWVAKKNSGECKNMVFMNADLMNLPFPEASFDLILAWGVLHHTPNTEKAFKKVATRLKPGGRYSVYIYGKSRRTPSDDHPV